MLLYYVYIYLFIFPSFYYPSLCYPPFVHYSFIYYLFIYLIIALGISVSQATAFVFQASSCAQTIQLGGNGNSLRFIRHETQGYRGLELRLAHSDAYKVP